jgi:hypothetical protein
VAVLSAWSVAAPVIDHKSTDRAIPARLLIIVFIVPEAVIGLFCSKKKRRAKLPGAFLILN